MINKYLKQSFYGLVLFLLLCTITNSTQAQLFVNKEIANAYNSATRSEDGKSGKNYWQNSSDYKINVKFTPESRIIDGQETITYFNNSPDTLKLLVVRLYQDIFKKGNKRTLEVDPGDLTDGVEVHSVKIHNQELLGEDKGNYIIRGGVNVNASLPGYGGGTNMYITLPEALAPKSSLEMSIKWSFKVPAKTQIRMGTYDSTSFFIGQWYPQIAVYDDINGWDTHDYTGLCEFYNDFSNFDVEISVPENFVVWATGNLDNANEVLNEPYLGKFLKAQNSAETVTIATPTDFKTSKVTKSNEWNVWKYHAKNISDFAFALSNHYVWEACSVETDKANGMKTFLQNAYNEEHADYKEVTEIGRKSLLFLSETRPGIPYPFPCMSIFDGADGMEYPMMTNIGSFDNRGETVYAHSHEITHSYFPFYVGTNETKYGWMDESMAVFLPEAIQKEIEPTKDMAPYTTYVYSYFGGKEFEPAVITPTYYLTKDIYFILNYGKAEQILRLLEMQLGKEIFDKCLKEFISRWKYKHPTPYDFFYTFNNVSGQNLDWFWKAWYFEQGVPDMAITSATYEKGKCTVKIKNTGNLPLPVSLQFTTEDGKTVSYDASADIWKDGKKETEIVKEVKQKVTAIKLGNAYIPDSKPSDNNLKIK